MTGSEPVPAKPFTRAPRTDRPRKDVSQENFLDSIDAIDAFLTHATSGGRDAFQRNSPAHASGSMAIIRAAALFETDEFADFLATTPIEVFTALKTMRNIASHSGYRAMNDEFFWVTLTTELPPHVNRWRRTAQASASS